jgi:hypothetical protein
MNLDSLSFALSQINYLVANLTKKNYKSSVQELSCVRIVCAVNSSVVLD